MSRHQPVMLTEVLDYLQPQIGDTFIDCTLGAGSYTQALAQQVGQEGRVIAIDLDPQAISQAQIKFQQSGTLNIKFISGNFRDLATIAQSAGLKDNSCQGIVADLGLSSDQLADQARTFSFNSLGDLNMAFGPESPYSTLEIVNEFSLPELTKIFQEYGEDAHAYRVARAIVSFRRKERIARADQLINIVSQALPPSRFPKKIHPATKIWQALRIATNDELNNLHLMLPAAIKLLAPGGRLAIISFHSGEDRIVKYYFRYFSGLNLGEKKIVQQVPLIQPLTKLLTKKPLIPTAAEIADNPRSRSAKLRVLQKL